MSKAINVLGLVRTEWPELRKTLVEEAMLEGGCHKTPRRACNRIIPYYCTLCPASDKPLDQCAGKRHLLRPSFQAENGDCWPRYDGGIGKKKGSEELFLRYSP
jgi:hypothetical protein